MVMKANSNESEENIQEKLNIRVVTKSISLIGEHFMSCQQLRVLAWRI
jgi:hypothetical protein